MSEAPDEPTELSALEPTAAPRRRRRWALWGTLAVVALGAGAVAVIGPDDGDPPQLPVALGAAPAEGRSSAAPMAAADSMLAFVHYVAGNDLPALGGPGPAYRAHGPDEAAVQALAEAVGLPADAERNHHDGRWEVTDTTPTSEGNPQLQVGDDGSWSYYRIMGTPGSVDGSGGNGGSIGTGGSCNDDCDASTSSEPDVEASYPACPPDARCIEPMPTTIVPTPPADLPSKDEAQAIARDLFRAAGADLDGVDLRVDGPYDGWQVSFEPRLDGLPVSGLSWSATIGPKGAILGASGTIARYEHLGSYPTLDTAKAIDRLNDGSAWGGPGVAARDLVAPAIGCAVPDVPITTIPPETTELVDPATSSVTATEPAVGSCAPAVPAEPTEVVLHGAERILVVLMASDGSDHQYLVPGYRLTGADGAVVEVPSVDDESLLPTTTVPVDVTGSTAPATGCAPMAPGPDGAVPDICMPVDEGGTHQPLRG